MDHFRTFSSLFLDLEWIMALLEVQFLESEVSLHDACSLDPSSQHILL